MREELISWLSRSPPCDIYLQWGYWCVPLFVQSQTNDTALQLTDSEDKNPPASHVFQNLTEGTEEGSMTFAMNYNYNITANSMCEVEKHHKKMENKGEKANQ